MIEWLVENLREEREGREEIQREERGKMSQWHVAVDCVPQLSMSHETGKKAPIFERKNPNFRSLPFSLFVVISTADRSSSPCTALF